MNWIIKPGFFMKAVKGMKQAGLDLGRVIGDWLKAQGHAVSSDCCKYYPSIPLLETSDPSVPTADEYADVPLWGMFRTYDSGAGEVYIWMKDADDSIFQIANNA